MLLSTLVLLLIFNQYYVAYQIGSSRVLVDMSTTVATLDPRFVSLTYEIQNFIFNKKRFNWGSQRLKKLVEAYSPQVMRCGGTWEDGMLWEEGPQTGICPTWNPPAPPRSAVNLTVAEWDAFASFVDEIPGLDVVVGLNSLLRHWGDCRVRSDQSCPGLIPIDLSNAISFIKYNKDKNHNIWGYELGNEPGVWNWTWGTPIVTPTQHARDFVALQKVLDSQFPLHSVITRPHVVGPDPTWGPVGDEQPSGGRGPSVWDYWNDTIQQNPAVDVAAFHYYSIQPSLVKSWENFITIARDRSMCTAVAAFTRDFASSPLSTPLWLGEGGPSFGGAGGDWLLLYGGGLNYLEDLGCAAANGVSVFARYTLMNLVGTAKENYEPNPSYWVGYLWKQLAGSTVFSLSSSDDQIHAYALTPKNKTAKVVVAFINWHGATDSSVNLQVAVDDFRCKQANLYLLTPTATKHSVPHVRATGIKLNGKELITASDGTMPPLTAITTACQTDGSAMIVVPPLTGGFVVLV